MSSGLSAGKDGRTRICGRRASAALKREGRCGTIKCFILSEIPGRAEGRDRRAPGERNCKDRKRERCAYVPESVEGTYNYLKALWHIQKSLVCALIYTTSTPLEIGFDIANSWEYYSAFAGYSHLHIIKAACGLTEAPLSDFTINLISQVSTNITGIHGLVRRVGGDSFPPYFFSAKKWELTCKR